VKKFADPYWEKIMITHLTKNKQRFWQRLGESISEPAHNFPLKCWGNLEHVTIWFKITLIVTLNACLGDIRFAESQVLQDGRRHSTTTYFHLNVDGSLRPHDSSIVTNVPETDPVLTMLGNEITRKELGLKDEKWDVLKSDFESAQKLLEKYTHIVKQRKPMAHETDTFKREVESYLKAIRNALTEDQWNRAQQLGNRFSMRLAGPSMSIFAGELGNRLEIPIKVRSAVFQAGVRLAEPLRNESSELKKQAIERLTNLLTPDHQAELAEYFKTNGFQPENMNFGILVWQLGNAIKDKSEQSLTVAGGLTNDRLKENFEELFEVSIFKLSIDGSFEPVTLTVQDSRRKEDLNFKLLLLLLNPEIAKPLMLSKEQITELQDALTELQERTDEITREFEFSHDQPNIVKKLKLDQTSAYAKVDGLAEKVLLPHQMEWLKEFVGRVAVSRIGLVGSLIDGQLGRKLGITEEEKKALQHEAEKIREELMEKSLELENKIYEELIAVLSEEDAKRLRSMIGDPIQEGYANLDLLADQLLGKSGN
jgi:hypothetical protein